MTANNPKREAAFQENVALLASNLTIATSATAGYTVTPDPSPQPAPDERVEIVARVEALGMVGFTPDQVQAIYAYRDHVRGLGYPVGEVTLLVIGFASGLEYLAAHPVQDEEAARAYFGEGYEFALTHLDDEPVQADLARLRPAHPVQVTTAEESIGDRCARMCPDINGEHRCTLDVTP